VTPRTEPARSTRAEVPARPRSLVRSSVLRFVLASAAALLIIAVGTTIIGVHVAREQALRAAREHASLLAQQVAAPLVDEGVRRGDPTATARLDAAMRARMTNGALSHIKLWSKDGSVLWADETVLTGRRYEMEEDVRSLFGTTDATAAVSALDRPENVEERDEEELLEVYAGAVDADGEDIVFEAYLPLDDLRRDETAIISGVLAVGLGGLVLFQAAVLPLAVRLARRVEQSQAERTRMVRHALEASELERRRIAGQLHDGVIQDLAGIHFALPTVAPQIVDGPAGREAKETLRTITDLVADNGNALRTMLMDLYPPDLAGSGLALAVEDVARSTREEGISVVVEMDDDLEVPIEAATLVYRVIREGLRNVVRHAEASSATVQVRETHGKLEVTVTDDGRGPVDAADVASGHFGIQLLKDTVRDLGGDVTLASSGHGAVLHATMPADLLAP
jgi:signal transduction histidine kinase